MLKKPTNVNQYIFVVLACLLHHKNLSRIKDVLLQTSETRKTVIFHASKTPLKGCHIM